MTAYYARGFKIDGDVFKYVKFLPTWNKREVLVSGIDSNKLLTIKYIHGDKAGSYGGDLPSGVEVEYPEVIISDLTKTKLEPRVTDFEGDRIEMYNLDHRVLNYLVVVEEASLVIETYNHTSIIVNQADVANESELQSLLEQSEFLKFLDIPVGKVNSFEGISSASSTTKILSISKNPIYMKKYNRYLIQYVDVLNEWVERMEEILPGFTIHDITTEEKDNDKKKAIDKVVYKLEGPINTLDRRPFCISELTNVLQSRARLSMTLTTDDFLKYTDLRNKIMNLEVITKLTTFNVKDENGEEWSVAIKWDPLNDNYDPRMIKDEQNRFSYSIPLSCEFFFFTVEDRSFYKIEKINIMYLNLETKKKLINN